MLNSKNNFGRVREKKSKLKEKIPLEKRNLMCSDSIREKARKFRVKIN